MGGYCKFGIEYIPFAFEWEKSRREWEKINSIGVNKIRRAE